MTWSQQVKIEPFRLERYFAEHEFTSPYLLSCSDCEPRTLAGLLALADEDSLRRWEKLGLGYTESAGLADLRVEISRLYGRIRPEHVLVAVPEEAIFVALNCMLDKGDHAVCTFPGYQSLYEIPRALGCEVSPWRPRRDEGWRFDVDELAGLVRPGTKAVVVNFPHNPTGALPTAPEFERVVEVARESGAWLLSDEMYRFLEYDPAGRLRPACDLYERAVSLSGMSKAFGMAGVRIGWLATRDPGLFRKMAAFKDYTTICPPAPSEVLALAALRARDIILEANLALVRENLGLVEGFMSRHPRIFEPVKPVAGTTCFPGLLSGGDDTGFCRAVVEGCGVLLLPSSVFGVEGHVRIGLGRTGVPEALDRLERFLEESGPPSL